MVTFFIKGDGDNVKKFFKALKVCGRATCLCHAYAYAKSMKLSIFTVNLTNVHRAAGVRRIFVCIVSCFVVLSLYSFWVVVVVTSHTSGNVIMVSVYV